MASGDAPAARICFEIVKRYILRAEPELLPHVAFCVGGMNVVAGPAGPALFHVDMQRMEIDLSVSEECNGRGFPRCHHCLCMTEETETICPLAVRGIKLRRERLAENIRVIGTVRVVTRRAIALYDRTMLKPHRLPGTPFLMTGIAQVVHLFPQKVCIR